MADFYYKKYGKGINNLICFHGFGERHTSFDNMISEIQREYPDVSCYSIDLYYHGESTREEKPLKPDEWIKSFQNFLQKEAIESFSLIGFSLGGRFAITTALGLPGATNSLFLIAPDGIFQSFWYMLANTYLGNILFKTLMEHPKTFNRLMGLFKKTRLIPRAIAKFVEVTLHSLPQRKRVYQSWSYFHSLQISVKNINTSLAKHNIPTYVILGDQDTIIPPQKIITRLKPTDQLSFKVIKSKHHQMIAESTPHIISSLKNQNL